MDIFVEQMYSNDKSKKVTVDRYSLDKTFIATGQLQIEAKDHSTILTYLTTKIKVSENGLYHPIVALENLRQQLAVDFNSALGINGGVTQTTERPAAMDVI